MPFSNRMNGGKVTLFAFVELPPTVHIHMNLKTANIVRGIVTLLAFMWLHSSMCQHMYIQVILLNGRIIA